VGTGPDTALAAFALFDTLDAGVTMEEQVDLAEHPVRTGRYAVPAGLAAIGHQDNMSGLGVAVW
jgi:hypothetical protein